MAFVITQPCIGVKDTACVDACPTDAIHSYADSVQLYIEPATCIDCAACEPACPVKAIFPGDQVPAEMTKFIAINADFFKTFDKSKSASYTRVKKDEEKKGGEAEGTTSTSEISKEADISWSEQPGWEEVWDRHRNDPLMDRVEVHKRYGRARTVIEQDDRYTVRFQLPETMPNHPFVYRYGLGSEMPTYTVTAELKGNTVTIRAHMADPKIARLSGLANSFPDRFYVEYPFDKDVTSVSVQMRGKHVVDVIAMKRNADSKAA